MRQRGCLDVGELPRHNVRVGGLTSTDRMPRVSKAWPLRLLAAAVALALAVAHAVGAYAHAAGHQLPHAGHPVVIQSAAMAGTQPHADHGGEGAQHAPASVVLAPDRDHAHGPADGGQGEDHHPGHSLDSCDTICHGGQAILAAAPVVPAPLLAAPSIEPAAALHGADPGGLDRPPKPFRPA
jgi:hypothetical protein